MSSDVEVSESPRGTAGEGFDDDGTQRTWDELLSSSSRGLSPEVVDTNGISFSSDTYDPDLTPPIVRDDAAVGPHVETRFGPLSSVRRHEPRDRFRVVDLFCGAGGTSSGVWQAGGTLVAGVDSNETALEAHAENLPGEHIHHDLRTVDPDILPTTDIHHMHGSPPCPGFSPASGNRSPDDERNTLVWSFIEWCAAVGPTVATMENVAGMATITDHWMDRVVAAFEEAGYTARWRTLNAADYGVPQTRRRIFVVAIRDESAIDPPSRWFPRPTHAKGGTMTLDGRRLDEWETVRSAIGDLADVRSGDYLTGQVNEAHQLNGRRRMPTVDEPAQTVRAGTPPQWRPQPVPSRSTVPSDHIPIDHDPGAREKMARIPLGKTVGLVTSSRLDPDRPSRTLVAGRSPPIHYKGAVPSGSRLGDDTPDRDGEAEDDAVPPGLDERVPDDVAHAPSCTVTASRPYLLERRHGHRIADRTVRRLTIREAARLQSFGDWFSFVGNKTQRFQQVGNAVPPRLAQHIASHIHSLLKTEAYASVSSSST